MKVLLTTEEFLNFHRNLGKHFSLCQRGFKWEDLLLEL